jgi:hemerythrin
MPFMNWTEMLAVDDAVVDEQHRDLFAAINSFHEAVAEGSGLPAVTRTLDRLLAQSELHFADEERLLTEASYPHLDQHHRQHQQFLEQIVAFIKQLEKCGSGLGHSMSQFLGSWLVNHIMISDKAYAGFLRGDGSGSASSGRLRVVRASALPHPA